MNTLDSGVRVRARRRRHGLPTSIAATVSVCVASAIYYFAISLALHPVDDSHKLEYDPREYYTISSEQLRGHFEFNPRRTPFYPLLLSAFRLTTADHIVATQLLAAVFFSLSAPLAYVLVRNTLRNDFIALTVAGLVIVWPSYALFAGMLYSEAAALPFFIAFLVLLPRGSLLRPNATPNCAKSVYAGLLLASCVLLRPMYIFFYPFALAILLLEEPYRKTAVTRCILMSAGWLALIVPWSAYSSSRAGIPVIISANGGETLAGGLTPRLLTYGMEKNQLKMRNAWNGLGKWLGPEQSGYLSLREQKLPYIQRDLLLRRRALEWVMHNPSAALYLERAKCLYMWGFWPFSIREKQTLLGNLPVLMFILLSIVALTRLSATSVCQLSRFWCLPLFSTLVALFSWGSWRFRQPGDIGLLTLGVLGVWLLLGRKLKPLHRDNHDHSFRRDQYADRATVPRPSQL